MKRLALAMIATLVLAGASSAHADDAILKAEDDTTHQQEANHNRVLVDDWIDRLQQEATLVSGALAVPATMVPPGGLLREGMSGPRVIRLTQRLGELGYALPEGAGTGAVISADVRDLIERFQSDRGLFVDGLVGPQTLGELNRTPRDTLAALSWTIERLQEARADFPDRVLLINIPSLEAQLLRDGETILDMQAVVGRPTRRTPLLTDRIFRIVLNPRWTVPPTIMREDVLPRLRADGESGIAHSTVILDGEVVDPTLVDWTDVSPWQITVRQSPGNHNALGRYLFSLTNGQNIFVHDTNSHSVFQRAHRWVSSGCVRVSQARELAEYLATENGYSIAELDRAFHRGRTRMFMLDQPLPVLMTYFMATVEDDGSITYHRDVYGRMRDYEPNLSWTVSVTAPDPTASPDADGGAVGLAGALDGGES